MSKETFIGMLRQGNTGDEILSILNVIAEVDSEVSEENECDSWIGVTPDGTGPQNRVL